MTITKHPAPCHCARLGALLLLLAFAGCVYEPMSPPPSEYGYYNGYYYGAGYYTPYPAFVGSVAVGGHWHGGHWGGWHRHG
jgi:hypothetical protein